MAHNDNSKPASENQLRKFGPVARALTRGFCHMFAALSFALVWWVVSEDSKSPVLFGLAHHKTLFVIGILVSVWAQTTVPYYFASKGQLRLNDHDEKGFVEGFSNHVLTCLTILSLATIESFWPHVCFTLAYLAVVLALDCYVWNRARDDKNKLLAQMCGDLTMKVDGISFVGLTVLCGIGILIATQRTHSSSQGTGAEGASTEQFIEIFLSGAIGFQLIATAWLIFVLLLEWDKRVAIPPPNATTVDNAGELMAAGQTPEPES